LQLVPAAFVVVPAKAPEKVVAMKVKNSMHKGVHWVSPDTPVATVAKMMLEQDIGAIPVGENDRLVGMITDRDIALQAVADGKDISRLTARTVMTPGIVWCRDSDDVSQALQAMGSKQVRRLPVIDKDKRMVGILSLGDLTHTASQRIAADAAKAVTGHHD
jgi:CBS domain-containing protein